MALFGLFAKPDRYEEGYGDGQQYAQERPGLDAPDLAQAQISASTINQDMGLNELENEDWQGGFVDGYTGETYGESHRQSLYSSVLEEEAKPGGFLRRLFR